MSVMSRIRNNLALVAAVIAIAILAFVVQDGLSKLIGGGGGAPDVGEIAGQPISYEEYSEMYRINLDNERARSGGASMTDSRRYQIMDQTWSQMVSDRVYENELKKTGIEVTGAELAELFTGTNLSPYMSSYFGGFFDQNPETFPGGLTGANIRKYIDNLQQQGTREQQVSFKQFETFVKDARARERFTNMVQAGYVGSNAFARQKYLEQNRTSDIAFLAVNYTSIPDSTVQLSDRDFQNYINDNKYLFEQQDETSLRYVRFDVSPKAVDSTRAYTKVEKLKASFADALGDSVFVSNKSRTPFNGNPVAISDIIVPEVRDSLKDASPKTVIGPILDRGYYKLFKLVNAQDTSESWSKVSHILVRPAGPTAQDTADARKKAADLARQANSGNFAQLAQDNSDDFASKSTGGELGWYRKGTYGEDFDEAVSNASVGRTIGPIKSNQGFHVVRIADRTNKVYVVAEVEQEIYAGNRTIDEVNKRANVFAAKAMNSGDIEAAASEENLPSYSSGALLNETKTISGITEGARDIVLWALEANVGDFSEVFEAGESYVFAQVVGKKKEGTQSVEDVRAQIRTQVLNKKKAEIILDKLNGLDNTDLQAMATAYGQGAFVDNASGVNFSNTNIQKIGNDPLIVGLVSGMQEGTVSSAVEGTNGVYVIQVTKVNEPEEPTEEAVTTQKTTEVLTGKNALAGKIDQGLIELADVQDERHKANY